MRKNSAENAYFLRWFSLTGQGQTQKMRFFRGIYAVIFTEIYDDTGLVGRIPAMVRIDLSECVFCNLFSKKEQVNTIIYT